ncbi:MAG: AAA family ATPase, partial [Candidatus Omnitrophica bacterium]|nr:AAA family ATPase [Candidatus Omnitrophota bacterium]
MRAGPISEIIENIISEAASRHEIKGIVSGAINPQINYDFWKARFLGIGQVKIQTAAKVLKAVYEAMAQSQAEELMAEYKTLSQGNENEKKLAAIILNALTSTEASAEPALPEVPLEDLNASYTVFNKELRTAEEKLLVPTDEMKDIEARIVGAWKAKKRIVVLQGGPGGGKTDIFIDVGERFGFPVEVYSAHGLSSLEDIIGGFTQDEQGRIILTAEPDSQGHYKIPFLEMLTHGGLFIIDEGAVGERSRALISLLTGLARGEKIFVLNQFPGRPRKVLEVHPEFHIGITTNDPENTPGREQLPIEVLENSEIIDVPNRYSTISYLNIIKRFLSLFVNLGEMPGHDQYILREDILNYHREMIEYVEKLLEESEERHLLTLRDIKNWARAIEYFRSKGNDINVSVNLAFDLVYLRQFTKEERAKIVQYLKTKHWNFAEISENASSEQEIIKHISAVSSIGQHMHTLLLLEPGAREQEILDKFTAQEGYEVYDLESSPELTSLELLGGAFPILEGEEFYGLMDFRVKPAFLTRHLVPEDKKGEEGPKKLLVIHNIDALPERVRALLNNFLIKGYILQKDDSGKTVKLVLPKNVKIVATMSALSQRDFSSAFFNRFVKLNVAAMEAKESEITEFTKTIMAKYGLTMREAKKIETLFLLIKVNEQDNVIWGSGKNYQFTIKEAFLHAQFVGLAITAAKARVENLSEIGREKIIIEEAIRVYGAALKENQQDFDIFIRTMLEQLFSEVDRKDLSGAISYRADGHPEELAGVEVKAASQPKIDIKVRLTLVPKIINTLSTILRGWQADKFVSLTGETAAVKTTMGKYLAQLTGVEYYLYSAHRQSKARDLTAALTLGEDGKYKLEIREFLERIQKDDQLIILDEINFKPEILWILNGLARGQKEFTVEIPGEKPMKFKIGKNVRFLLTMNPEDYS